VAEEKIQKTTMGNNRYLFLNEAKYLIKQKTIGKFKTGRIN